MQTGSSQLPVLSEVVNNSAYYEFARTAASEALTKTALYYPGKREEIISECEKLLQNFINNPTDNDEDATDILSSVICD